MRAAVLTLLLVLGVAAPAGAAEGIMPLGQVQKGMRCTGLSVVQGTQVSSFDVEVLDVIAGDPGSQSPRILIAVSGPAVDRTGLGPGFSGSPIICRDGRGVERYAGAISESVGEYGGKVGLATPMEAVVGQPVEPPLGASPARATMRRAKPLSAPLSFGGVSPRAGRFLSRLARREGRLLLTAPGRQRAAFYPPQTLVPGSAMSAGLSSGSITGGAIGTVAYVDDDRVWAFGHPLDASGRRSLLLQDAYVYTVINNPVGIEGVSTYKLAAPGNDLGIVSGDGLQAIAGRVGTPPPTFPMKVTARDKDTGRTRFLQLRVSDESDVGLPSGSSPLAYAGSAAVAEAAATVLGEIPGRQSGDMCVTIRARELRKPMYFCNRYVMHTAGFTEEDGVGAGAAMVTDFVDAIGRIDAYEFAPLHITGVEIGMRLRRGLRQAHLLKLRAPRVVRRGKRARLRLKLQTVRSAKPVWRTVRVRIPYRIPRGPRYLTLRGAPLDEVGGAFEIELAEDLFADEEDSATGPRTIKALARSVNAIQRYDGVRVSLQPIDPDEVDLFGEEEAPRGAEGRARRQRRAFRDPDLRLSGTVRARVKVR